VTVILRLKYKRQALEEREINVQKVSVKIREGNHFEDHGVGGIILKWNLNQQGTKV
jgi:hypothetical protein